MAGQPVPFPDIRPTTRSFQAGEYPMSMFRAQNGATVAVRFGIRPSNCQLKLTFENITDDKAVEILNHYEAVNSNWDYVDFYADGVKSMESGVESDSMRTMLRGTNPGTEMKYRYASPPQVQYVFMNVCSVTCEFIGYLDGGLD